MTENITDLRPFEVGEIVRTRNVVPGFEGTIVHMDSLTGLALLVAKRVGEDVPWETVHVGTHRLEHISDGPVTSPTVADMGQAMIDRIKALNSLRTKLEQSHEAFREQVRDLAIEKAQELGWCTPGLNAALEELGLPPKVTRWDVELTITAIQTVTVTVEADDAQEAERKVYAMDDTMSFADRSAWEWHSEQVEEVNPVDD